MRIPFCTYTIIKFNAGSIYNRWATDLYAVRRNFLGFIPTGYAHLTSMPITYIWGIDSEIIQDKCMTNPLTQAYHKAKELQEPGPKIPKKEVMKMKDVELIIAEKS